MTDAGADLTAAELEEVRQLEQSLWRPDTRFDRGHLERILAPGFFEFGHSGRTHDRADILASDPVDFEASLTDLALHPLSADAILVTYGCTVRRGDEEVSAKRSSVWRREDGRWRILFHQGTPFEAKSGANQPPQEDGG